MSDPTRWPLAWPKGRARTPASKRRSAPFHRIATETRPSPGGSYTFQHKKDLSIADAIARLQKELDLLGARHPVVSSNVELRLDGLPYSNRKQPEDPGVAVYFHLSIRDERTGVVTHDPVSLCCDKYKTVSDNIAAIAGHIHATRAVERYGVGTLRDIYRGYMALPETATAVDDWRSILGEPRTLQEAENTYREAMRTAHPDRGGSHAEAARLNAAIKMAREWFKPVHA